MSETHLIRVADRVADCRFCAQQGHRVPAEFSTHTKILYRGELRGEYSWRVDYVCLAHATRYALRHKVPVPGKPTQ